MNDFLSSEGHPLFGDQALNQHILEVIERTGVKEKRKRRLDARLTMYLVLGMSVYRSQSAPEVLTTILQNLRDLIEDLPYRPASESAISEARYRIGSKPLEELFNARASLIAPPPTALGLSLWAIDGVRFQLPDFPVIEEAFGRPKPGRGSTAYPVALVVALVDTYGHRVKRITVNRHDASERASVCALVEGLGAKDLVLLDRGYPAADLFYSLLQRGVNFAARLTAAWKPKTRKVLGKGDTIVSIMLKVPTGETTKSGKRRMRTVNMLLRVLTYKVNGKLVSLITNLLSPKKYPAMEVAALYHERWEIEMVYDEVKNHFATVTHGTQKLCFRSQLVEGVRQEIYALFVSYNFVREIIVRAAAHGNLKPREISFLAALNEIRRFIPLMAMCSDCIQLDVSNTFELFDRLLHIISTFCRLRRRRKRQCVRKVKVKMSDFQCKKPTDKEKRINDRIVMRTPAPRQARAA
jgi:hypothetical protein